MQATETRRKGFARCDECGAIEASTLMFHVSEGPSLAPLRFCNADEVRAWLEAHV